MEKKKENKLTVFQAMNEVKMIGLNRKVAGKKYNTELHNLTEWKKLFKAKGLVF